MHELIEKNRDAIVDLCLRFAVRRLDVFGSAVTDEFNLDRSDLDFLVTFIPKTPEGAADRYFGLLHGLEDLFGRKIDLVCESAVNNRYFQSSVDSTKQPLYAA